MYTVFLAGGMGTRLSEETTKIPKPMIKIGNKPILFHIMKHYSKSNFKKFIIRLSNFYLIIIFFQFLSYLPSSVETNYSFFRNTS